MTDEQRQPEVAMQPEPTTQPKVAQEQKTVEIPAAAKQEQIKFMVEIDNKDVPGIYSNAVSVRAQNQEVVIDFGYIVPKLSAEAQDFIRLIQRVNIPISTAFEFANVLMGTMKQVAFQQQLQQPQPLNNPKNL